MAVKKQQALATQLQAFVGQEAGPPEAGPDPVNEAMIRHWCEAIGDRNPVYTDPDAARRSVHEGIVAPPTMLQAWVMPGLEMARPAAAPRNRQLELHRLLTQAGYSSVVATNCEQEYRRYLRPGERVSATTVIESISEEKATALGIGFFIDTRTLFRGQDGDEVGSMRFRVLKFKPGELPKSAGTEAAPTRPTRLRPPKGHDNAWWWEGIERGELLIQKCSACGQLRHPPRPMCGNCRALDWETVVSGGRGTIHSYVVMHHPQVPGYAYPLAIALIDLDEGTRIVANLAGCEPDEIHIGMRLQGGIEAVDDQLELPVFRPAR